MIQLFVIVGLTCIVISGLFIGAWTNGQQQRANYHSETDVHRNFRTRIAMYAGLAGVISLLIAGLIYLL
ncbi:DUF5316 family protein [Cytobacillus firmus]|uniref:DUF5316 family protein n=1 Tax=Cytobacillus firmus TaxID=1399 RepID=UPI001C9540C9|nr:DUF5316 family protein [Cytobacillus firmus]MBY6054746.1 DUF5316 domain-containing protein [Cytobacillus firmus]